MNAVRSPVRAAAQPSLRQLLEAPPEFVELLPVAAYACDAAGRLLWFNQLAVTLWGRAPRIGDDTELFCGSYRLYFDGREIGRHQTPMAHALRSGEEVKGVEAIVERPDGSRIHAMVHIAPVKDQAGRVVGAINCFHDTTELQRARDALQDKQEELEDFFDNAAVPLHIVSSKGIIVRANQAELELLGYAPEEYIGRNIAEFHADADTIADILARLGRGERLEQYPARLRSRDGSIRHVAITSSSRFRDGRFVNTRCFTEDVTAEVEAKARIAETEDSYLQLLEALPAAVYTTGPDGTITYYNRACVEMSGRTPELGKDKWCVTWRLYGADGKRLPFEECPMAITLRENRPVRNVEVMAERPDGTLIPILPHPTPIRNARGELVGAVNMLIDISERKQAENRQLVLLNELNHRVKNNMQMLVALLTSAQRDSASPEARGVLSDAARRVAAMAAAQQVLYEQGQPTTVRARSFLEAVCSAAQSAFDKGIDVRIEMASGVVSNDTAMPLALILNELLTNAVKHAVNGSSTGTIRVGVAMDQDEHRLWVHDEGPGFDLGTAIRKRSSGLGLVEGLARQLGGSFSVERKGGAVCIVTFRDRNASTQ